ncbi:hypothetical protein KW785_01860 [Candidatus Parcubacteria bacterium]|nr:hypothetical protein [Candidatus Parcubacteria bacterium]
MPEWSPEHLKKPRVINLIIWLGSETIAIDARPYADEVFGIAEYLIRPNALAEVLPIGTNYWEGGRLFGKIKAIKYAADKNEFDLTLKISKNCPFEKALIAYFRDQKNGWRAEV